MAEGRACVCAHVHECVCVWLILLVRVWQLKGAHVHECVCVWLVLLERVWQLKAGANGLYKTGTRNAGRWEGRLPWPCLAWPCLA